MPTYEYRCDVCEADREVKKLMSDYNPGDMPPCDECGSAMRRVFLNAPSFTVQGGTGAQRRA